MVAQSTCSPARQCWLRAWDRAKSEKLIPFRNADGSWSVKSYTVRVTGPGWSALSCDCAAGRNARVCKHVAVTAKAIAAGVRPIRPALVALEGAEKAGAAFSVEYAAERAACIAAGASNRVADQYARSAPAFRPMASTVIAGDDPLAVAFN